jgi:hypothetical protein
VDDREIVVKTTDGKDRTVRLDGDTECRDAQGDSTCSAVKPGDRVVIITRSQDGGVVADEIRFSTGAKTSAAEPNEEPSPHGHSHGGHTHSDEGEGQ